MRNKKILAITPVLLVICAIGVLLIRESYSAPDMPMAIDAAAQQEKYYYIRRNMLSHHYITSNSNPSGTILIKSDDPDSVSGTRKIVYCAHKGKEIAKSRNNKYYVNVPISQTSVTALKNAQDNLTGIMVNSYPYISLAELKSKIKAGIGDSEYNQYQFDTLDAQEAMTATQAAIWNAIDGKKNSTYSSTKTIKSLSYYNFHKSGNKVWTIDWNKTDSYDIRSGCYNGTGSELNCGSKSTFLAAGDTAANTGTYKKSGTSMLKERINRLIDWYFTLKGSSSSAASASASIPSFGIQSGSASWTNEGRTLTVTILANNANFLYASENHYTINFTDLAGKNLNIASTTPVKSGEKITGYTYVINDITTQGVLAKVSATIPSSSSNVYIYEAADVSYKNTQYLIGVDLEGGSIPVTANLQVLNDSKGKVYLYKTKNKNATSTPSITYGNTLSDVCTVNNPCQEGAGFVIYAQDGSTVLKEFESGTTPTELSLPLGTYYIQEVSAPTGYTFNNVKQQFKIEENNTIVAIHYNNIPTRVCVKKVSTEDTNTTIDGAKLQIQSMSGGVYVDFTSSKQEDNGMYCTADAQLPEGIYYINEVEAPVNFAKTNTLYRFKVGNFDEEDISEEVVFGENVKIEDITLTSVGGITNVAVIKNKPGTVITKSDLATGGCVTGAHLTVKDATGRTVDEWTSSCEEGQDNHTLSLSEGKYTLVEEIAPDGYATAESIDFTVDSNGKANTSLDMKDAPIEVCFLKVSGSDKNKGIAGAEFEIYNSKGELYRKFISTENETCYQYMPAGKYTVKETKAPDGYQKLEKDIEITVRDTSVTQRFEITNEVIVEKTGMDSSQIVIIIASIFMIFGLGLVGYYGYKKQV